MSTAKHWINGFLVIMLLSVGLPFTASEDVTRDERVDLRDVVLQAKRFAESSEGPGVFKERFGELLSVLRAVAGSQAHIQAPDHSAASSTQNMDAGAFLLSLRGVPTLLPGYEFAGSPPDYFNTIESAPNTPPPRFALV